MSTSDLAQYVNYVRLGILALVVLLAVFSAVKRSRRRDSARTDLAQGILGAVVVVVMGLVAGQATSWVWIAALFAIGLVLGLVLGRIRPLVAWIGAFATIYFMMALLWDQGGSLAPGLGMLALGTAGIPLGQAIRGPAGGGPPVSQGRAAVRAAE